MSDTADLRLDLLGPFASFSTSSERAKVADLRVERLAREFCSRLGRQKKKHIRELVRILEAERQRGYDEGYIAGEQEWRY